MPEATEPNFQPAEQQIQNLSVVVKNSSQERSPDHLAAYIPPQISSAARDAVKAVVSVITNSRHKLESNPDLTIRAVQYTSMENAIALLKESGSQNSGEQQMRMYHAA